VLLAPYRNQVCVSAPSGFTEAANAAELEVMADAAPVAAAGAVAVEEGLTVTELSPDALA
jgi:hypothetical protein